MYRYTSPEHRSVLAADHVEAAEIFAGRTARALFGRRAYVRTMRHDCQTFDGRCHHYECFVGVEASPRDGGGCVGRNVWVYVTEVR